MISTDNSFSSISAQDVNLIPLVGEKEEMLIFDVTSDQSIVSNMNYNFEMPKGGLSSLIAIGEKDDFEFFNDAGADNLNFIRILNSDKYPGAFYKSLPLRKPEDMKSDKEETSTYDPAFKINRNIVKKWDIPNKQ